MSNSLQVRQANDGQCSAVEIYDIPFLLVENKFAAAAAFQVIKQIYAILMVLLRYADKMWGPRRKEEMDGQRSWLIKSSAQQRWSLNTQGN